MSDWKISRKGSACGRCGRTFTPGEPFVSAIFVAGADAPEQFVRMDACPSCFESEEREPFSRWLTRIPVKEEKKPLLDMGLAKEFLVRLTREGDPAHRRIALVLALLLLRKRRVKLRGERVEDGMTRMDLTIPTGDGELDVELPAPEVEEEEAEEITAELSRLFGLGPEEDESAA